MKHRSWLLRWVDLVGAWPRVTLLGLTIVTALSGWYGATHFLINSNLNDLIDQTSDWRLDFDEFERHFPDQVHTAMVVVSSRSIKDLEETTERVLAHLNSRPELFTAVAAPGSESFFRDHALLYMDLDQLDATADRLSRAQPLVAGVVAQPSIIGLLEVVSRAQQNDATAAAVVITDHIRASALNAQQQNFSAVNWTDEFFNLEDLRYQLIYLKPRSTFSDALPDAQVVAGLRQMVGQIQLPQGTRVQLTGEITLQHEEIEAAVDGITTAGWLAALLLLLVLIVGVRSGKIIGATFTMLTMGIIWTTAYAMFAVGEFNTLSLVFIVMFFGLGVDFALHFCLRFQESINGGQQDLSQALSASTKSVGRAISLCALTTSIGFLGFWPTAYAGLADLGVISAGGMVIAWLLTFTFLPAFFQTFGAPRAHQMALPTSERIVRWLLAHRRWVLMLTLAVGALAGGLALQARFDYSVLALKDPASPSMQALRELQREQLSTDYQLVALSEDALPITELLALTSVAKVSSIQQLVPNDQVAKSLVIEDLGFMFWDLLAREKFAAPSSTPQQIRAALRTTLDTTMQEAAVSPNREFAQALQGLLNLDDLALVAWEQALLSNLVEELSWLRRALTVQPIELEDVPATITQRMISPAGLKLNIITPAENIAEVDRLSAFINQVKGLVPHATGRPVIEWGVGAIVVEAFVQAALFAMLGITLVLLVALRRVGPAVLILCPLILAGACTFALGVLFGQSVNMASVLVLPLIFGLGVDNGIHVVDRFMLHAHSDGDEVGALMHSSTPRAVLLSTLTTLGAFAALSISPHHGTASIGMLLAVSVGLILVFTVFILPVLLSYLPAKLKES